MMAKKIYWKQCEQCGEKYQGRNTAKCPACGSSTWKFVPPAETPPKAEQ